MTIAYAGPPHIHALFCVKNCSVIASSWIPGTFNCSRCGHDINASLATYVMLDGRDIDVDEFPGKHLLSNYIAELGNDDVEFVVKYTLPSVDIKAPDETTNILLDYIDIDYSFGNPTPIGKIGISMFYSVAGNFIEVKFPELSKHSVGNVTILCCSPSSSVVLLLLNKFTSLPLLITI